MSESHSSPRTPQQRRLRFWLLGVAPAIAIAGILAIWLLGGRYVSTDNAYVKANLVNVSAEVSGTVSAIAVVENQPVHRGDLLMRIDPAAYDVAVAQAEATLRQTRLQIESTKASYAQKLAALASAQADLEFQKSHQRRIHEMYQKGVVSGAAQDEAEHGLQVARTRIVEVEQQIAEVRAQLGGNPDIAIDEHPSVRTAQAALDKAKLDLAHTDVRAPIDGIASKVPELGEYAMPGLPLMSVVGAKDLWIEANLKESQLEHVRAGQVVQIDVDAYPSTAWHGVVDSIGQATGSEFSLIPAQNATGNWVKVVQRIPVRIRIQTDSDAPLLRAGMSTEVHIDTRSGNDAQVAGQTDSTAETAAL